VPSTVVHLALAGLIAAALLGDAFDRRALLVVFAVTAIPDLDALVALVSTVGHRAALHTFVIPALGAVALAIDQWWLDESLLRRRWGLRGVRIAWVCVLCYAVAGIALDATRGVVNPFWPLHDQYYHVQGRLELSSRDGIVQTFVDLGTGATEAETRNAGTTADVELSTGANPQGSDPYLVPIVRDTWELVVLLVGAGITAARFHVDQSLSTE